MQACITLHLLLSMLFSHNSHLTHIHLCFASKFLFCIIKLCKGMWARETQSPSLRPEGCVSPPRANFSCELVSRVHSCHRSDRRSVQDNPLSSPLRVCSCISIGDILDRRREFEVGTDALRVTATAACALLSHFERTLKLGQRWNC